MSAVPVDPVLVPAGPLKRVLEEESAELEVDYELSHRIGQRVGSSKRTIGPRNAIASEIARYSGQRVVSIERNLARIRSGESRWVRFRTADTILCALGRPWEWYVDPELRQVYDTLGEGSDVL